MCTKVLYGSYIYFRGSISITSPERQQIDSDKISLQFYKTGFLDVTKPKETQLLNNAAKTSSYELRISENIQIKHVFQSKAFLLSH